MERFMRRIPGLLVVLVLFACQDAPLAFRADQPGPMLAISDGPHGGNPFVFFLPPLVPQPQFDGTFAADANPSVVVCTLVEDGCGEDVVTFDADDIAVLEGSFEIHWRTGERNGISTELDYRIEIRAGDLVVGFRDVDPKPSPKDVPAHPETEELYAFQNGRTIPIRFRLEDGFLCAALGFDPGTGACNEGNLGDGLIVQIPETGTGVSVPAQDVDLPVAIAVEPCPDGQNLPVDIPVYGTCIQIRTSTAIPALAPLAAVFICEVPEGLDERQLDLIHVHKSDALDGSAPVFALPNAPGLCPFEIDAEPGIALDRGAAGLTGGFSFFQFALPAKMEIHTGDNQVARPGAPVPVKPAVWVTDFDGLPVAGATVRFSVLQGGGSVTPVSVITGPDGLARVTWVLGLEGSQHLQASGRGIADPITNGPLPIFDPFRPIQLPNPFDESPAQLFTGVLDFNAQARR
jgi:hypothetical protein